MNEKDLIGVGLVTFNTLSRSNSLIVYIGHGSDIKMMVRVNTGSIIIQPSILGNREITQDNVSLVLGKFRIL